LQAPNTCQNKNEEYNGRYMIKDEEIIIEDDLDTTDDVVLEDTDDQNQELGSKAKIANLRKELVAARKERDEYLAQLQRERADGINLRKTEEAKRDNLKTILTGNMCEQLLPVLDSFDAAMGNKVAWESVEANWRIGVEYIYQQLVRVLEDSGVVADNPMSRPFDPLSHEPHDYRVVDDEAQDGVVVEVLQKGYKLKDLVIRPARVVVGKSKE